MVSNFWSSGSIWTQVRFGHVFYHLDEMRYSILPVYARHNLTSISFFVLGWGKYLDPLGGWSYQADPLPALDTYTRHTVPARYLYGMLGPEGMRIMTPVVVWIEIIAAPLAFLGAYLGWSGMVKFAIGLICQLHVGISITLRNSFLLSYIACAAWCVFLPIGWEREGSRANIRPPAATTNLHKLGTVISAILIGGMACGNLWFETIGASCASSDVRSIWGTLLQNRWNVFVGAEEYVCYHLTSN